ncbi:hypothetical protein Vadar_034408 [Vaccinium darrowii]|uniref:Uncharacterized protein n=1 Tax=Vaccinium darrowii TaxID=229202 RepID=A0ACB7XM10_9ERIC|nr:hypothetical protein Vadar_034408 [Vaccinium darrowii]
MDKLSITFYPAAPLEELIFGTAFLTVFGILQLPLEDVGGNPVPTVLFKDKPSFFHAFLLSLNFAFTGAGITIFLREGYPKIARHSRRLAIAFIVTAAGILTCLVLLSCFDKHVSISTALASQYLTYRLHHHSRRLLGRGGQSVALDCTSFASRRGLEIILRAHRAIKMLKQSFSHFWESEFSSWGSTISSLCSSSPLLAQMEALYPKLFDQYTKIYDKYTRLKTEKESEMDKFNHDQEVKFMKCITDELVEHLRNEKGRLHEEIDNLRREADSIRFTKDARNAEYQKLLMEEKQKNNQLSEEIERLRNLQREGLCCSAREGNTENGQLNMSGSSQVGSGILNDSDRNVTKKRSRHNGTAADITVAPCAGDLLEHASGRESASDLPKKTVSSGTSIVGQTECCRRKIDLSGGDTNVTGPAKCMFHDLIEFLVSMKLSTIPQTDGRCISAVHQSSGYSFSLTLVSNNAGDVELLYRVLSLGTFERVAPEWMKEEVLRFKARKGLFCFLPSFRFFDVQEIVTGDLRCIILSSAASFLPPPPSGGEDFALGRIPLPFLDLVPCPLHCPAPPLHYLHPVYLAHRAVGSQICSLTSFRHRGLAPVVLKFVSGSMGRHWSHILQLWFLGEEIE